MRLRSLLLGIILAAGSIAVPAVADDPGYVKHEHMVPVAEGTVILDAKVYLPTAPMPDGGWPLIVRHHGGGSEKDNAYDTGYALAAIPRGFAVLMYSVRGHGRSGGSFDFFGPESVSDFIEVLDWVDETFPTVDTDNVGANGISQGGGISLLTAALERDARIKAVAVGNTFDSLTHTLNPNDCFKFSFATGIFAAAYKSAGARTDDELAFRWGATWYTDTEDSTIPPQGPLSTPHMFDSTENEIATRSPVTYLDRLIARRIPVFWSNSWEDQLFPGDHPENILEPLEQEGIPTHYWFASGGHAAGPNDPEDELAKEEAMLDWFDEFLRGTPHGYSSPTAPEVDYVQRSGGDWVAKQAASWPIQPLGIDLHTNLDGLLGPQSEDEVVGVIVNDLANANIANDAIVSAEVPGRTPFTAMGQAIRSLPERGTAADTASFATTPLGEDLEVTGAPVVTVQIAETTAKTVLQLNAKVWDVAPDGSAQLINRGCTSGPPPTGGQVPLQLWPNSHVFRTGHSLRLDIAAVDFPVFEADKEPAVTVLGDGTKLSF